MAQSDVHSDDTIAKQGATRERFVQRRHLLFGAAAVGVGAVAIAATSASKANATVLTGHDEVFNVHDYGAVGDGVHPDGPGIQAAINAAAANPGGGTVYIPSGTYLVGATLTVATSHIAFRGEGPSSLLKGTFAAGDIISIAPSGTQLLAGTILENFAIYSTVSKTSGAAVSFRYVQDVRIVGLQCASRDVAGSGNYLYDGLTFSNFTGVTVETAMLTSHHCGLSVAADTNAGGVGADIWVTGGTIISNATIGVYAGGGVGGLYLDEVDIFGNGTHVLVDTALSATSSPNRELIFNNCVLDTAQNHGVEIMANGVYVLSFNATYGGNTGSLAQAGHPDGCIIRVHAGGILHPSSIVVNGCKFFNAYGDAIYAESGSWSITGCDISYNAQGTAGGYGIYLTGAATSNSMLVGNSIRENGAYPSAKPVGVGIRIDSSVNAYLIADNLVTDNGTAAITESGGPKKLVANNLS